MNIGDRVTEWLENCPVAVTTIRAASDDFLITNTGRKYNHLGINLDGAALHIAPYNPGDTDSQELYQLSRRLNDAVNRLQVRLANDATIGSAATLVELRMACYALACLLAKA